MTTYFIESTLKDEGTNSFNSNNLTLEDIFNINNVINNVWIFIKILWYYIFFMLSNNKLRFLVILFH